MPLGIEAGPRPAGRTARIPWWAAVFTLALAARLAYLLLVDEPILYTDQYFYFFGGLRIAGDPHPLRLIATSDEWRLWGGRWTIAPLYYLFTAAVFRLFGASPFPLQLLQCALGAASAVAVGALGREAAGPRGAWAGAAYAVYWPAVEMSRRVLTENLHVVLLLWALALVARGARRQATGEVTAAGALLGLSALARSVSSSFIPLAAWSALPPRGAAARWKPPVALMAAAAAVILPWSARNVVGTGSLAPIETLWAFNFLRDNAYERLRRFDDAFFQSKRPREAIAAAPRFIARGLWRNPGAFVDKLEVNFGKVVRAEGLHMALDVERPAPVWLLVASVAGDDLMLFAAAPLFAIFVLAGRPSAARRTIVLWSAYYVLMIAVVFHVETRYRSALVPVVLAGAAGGAAVLAEGQARRPRVVAGLLLGSLVLLANAWVYAAPALRAVAAARAMGKAEAALTRGDLGAAEAAAQAAVARDPGAARPWLAWTRALAAAGRPTEAVAACRRAAAARPRNPVAPVLLPQLLRESGRADESEAALGGAHDAETRAGVWQTLEAAWSALPPPRRDEVAVGSDDYGAVRGFFSARGTYRWTWKRSFLRLLPTRPAPAYEVTLVMGSPEPSPLSAPVVTVRAKGAPAVRFTLARASAPFTLRARPAPGAPVIVEITSPTWTRLGENADEGVAVERMTVAPARE